MRVTWVDGVFAVLGVAVVVAVARYEFRWPWVVVIIAAPFGALATVLLYRARAML